MRAPEATFRDRLLAHARDRADVPALVGRGAVVRYRELPDRVSALAGALRDMGLDAGAIVALTARAEIDHLLAVLALLELGASQVALASRDPSPLRERLAKRTGATLVLGDLASDALPGLAWVDLAEALDRACSRRATTPTTPRDQPSPRLFFTGSGTTGDPKVVAYAESDLALHAVAYPSLAGLRVLRPAHVEFNNSKRTRLYALLQGGTNVFSDGAVEPLRNQCIRGAADWIELSPLHAVDLVASCRADGPLPDRVRVKVGGARVPIALRREILRVAAKNLLVSYGSTETAFVSLAQPSMHDERECVGPPGAHATVDVVRSDGTAVPPGEIGEIRLRTPGMATSYVNDEGATARHFRDGWFMPGDLASLTPEGWLCLHGRVDDMMILDSINIFPAEIERVLESHPAVAAAVAFPVPSRAHGQIPVAAVEARPGYEVDVAELLGYARSRLGVRTPRKIAVLAPLPRNPGGKISRREVARRFRESGNG